MNILVFNIQYVTTLILQLTLLNQQSEKSIEKPVKTPDHEKEAMTNPEQYLAKSDSGFSEKTNIELEELDDEDYGPNFSIKFD